jgi:tRNA A-37 threonylcarbamoyl transferase component Bud32
MQLIGCELGRMHRADIIHGDLTTSNMIVRRTTTSTTATTSDVGAEAEAEAQIVSGRPSPGKQAGKLSH